MYVRYVFKEDQTATELKEEGKQDAHTGDERPSNDKCPKSSRDARSAGLVKGTMGSVTVRMGMAADQYYRGSSHERA